MSNKMNEYLIKCLEFIPFEVLQLTTPNHPSFSCPSRVSTIKPHSITAQNIRDSSGPNHFDSRSFCTATELPNCLMWLLLLLFVKWLFDVHHFIWPITLLALERGFCSITIIVQFFFSKINCRSEVVERNKILLFCVNTSMLISQWLCMNNPILIVFSAKNKISSAICLHINISSFKFSVFIHTLNAKICL